MTITTDKNTIQKTLVKALALRDQRQSAFREKYLALVRKCALGEQPSPESIVKSLDDWEIPVEKFQDDVETLIERLELREKYDRGPSAWAEIREINDNLDAARSERDRAILAAAESHKLAVAAAESKYTSAIEPLNAKKKAAAAVSAAAERAEEELKKTAPQEVIAELEQAKAEHEKLTTDLYIETRCASGNNTTAATLSSMGSRLIVLKQELQRYEHAIGIFETTKKKKIEAEYSRLRAEYDAMNAPRCEPQPDPTLTQAVEEAAARIAKAAEALLVP